jgi:hypothetical protein
MFEFENLLRNEYFPNELPPCFSSENLADNHVSVRNYLTASSVKIKTSTPTVFSGYKNINSRRKFAIPNPINYSNIALVLVNNTTDIFSIFKKSTKSLTVPRLKRPKRNESYAKTVSKISESKELIKKQYEDNLYEIRLDIQSFFNSIYTHSIPWAIYTKEVAKKKQRDYSLYGNVLDREIRNCNGAQTNGILVGNAISRIVSEILLCTIDNSITQKFKNIKYLRYVDDYYIYVKDSSQITNVITVFRNELAKFELSLNETKMVISESPFIYGKSWVEQMRSFSKLSPQLLLERAIIEFQLYKDISILKYGLNAIRTISIPIDDWSFIQPTIFNIWIKYPSLSEPIIMILKNNEVGLNKSLLRKSIYAILDSCLPLGFDEEVIWALWSIKVFNVSVSIDYLKKVLNTRNWTAIIIALDILSSRKTEKSVISVLENFKKQLVHEFFSDPLEDGMLTEIWLLAYEADLNEWLNTGVSIKFTFAQNNPFFKILRDLNVRFYNPNYSYRIIVSHSRDESLFVTRKELTDIMSEYMKTINLTTLDKPTFNVEVEMLRRIRKTLKDKETY